MTVSNLKNALFIALTLFVFAGCQLQEAPPQLSDAAGFALKKGEDPTCNVNEEREFSLIVFDPQMYAPDADYGFSLSSTEPYSDEDCLCLLTEYRATFSSLPQDHSEITVTDNHENTLQFTVTTDPATGAETIVVQATELEDASFAIFIGFSNTVPAAPTAGGLCIVDNLDGNDPYIPNGTYYNTPLWIYQLPPQGPYINKVFIPTAMTDPT